MLEYTSDYELMVFRLIFPAKLEFHWEGPGPDGSRLSEDGFREAITGPIPINEGRSNAARAVLDIRTDLRDSGGQSILYLLRRFGHLSCMDPRDKVFALLSLLRDDDPMRQVFPDYHLTIEQVVCRTVEFLGREIDRSPRAIADLRLLVWKVFRLHPDVYELEVRRLEE